MVKKVNSREFIKELSVRLNCPLEKSVLINNILESNFFISKKNKSTIIEEFVFFIKCRQKRSGKNL